MTRRSFFGCLFAAPLAANAETVAQTEALEFTWHEAGWCFENGRWTWYSRPQTISVPADHHIYYLAPDGPYVIDR